MRVSVSRRSKNFPRPTSSSNFLSHLASTREALFFSLQPWSKSWTIPSWKRRFFSRSNRGPSTLISMSMLYGWIANLKRALLSSFFPSPPSSRQFKGGEAVAGKKLARKTRFYPSLSSPIIHSLFWRQGVVYVGRPRWKDNRARSKERGGLLISRRSTIIIGNGTRHDRDGEEKWGSVPREPRGGWLS